MNYKNRIAAVQKALALPSGLPATLPVLIFTHLLDPAGQAVTHSALRSRLLKRGAITEATTDEQIREAVEQLEAIGVVSIKDPDGVVPIYSALYVSVETWQTDPIYAEIECALPHEQINVGKSVYEILSRSLHPMTDREIARSIQPSLDSSEWVAPFNAVAEALAALYYADFVVNDGTRPESGLADEQPAFRVNQQPRKV